MMRGTKALILILILAILSVSWGSAPTSTYSGNYALSFDGVDDYISIQPSYLDEGLDDTWTLEAWINPTDQQKYFQLNIVGFAGRHPNLEYCGGGNWQCAKGSPLTQLRESNGEYYVVVGDPDKLSPDSWHHICGTWDNVTLSLYVDGELDASVKPYEQNYTEGHGCKYYDCDVGIQIGGYRLRTSDGYFSSQYFRGYMDEVRVWKVGRTQKEIQNTMYQTISGSEPGLQYYWRFDEGKGSVVKSNAMDAYGLLGGGNKDAEPRYIQSGAPIEGGKDTISTDTLVIEKNSPYAVLAGGFIASFFLCGGAIIGFIAGWKVHEKRRGIKFVWESDGLLSGRRNSFGHDDDLRTEEPKKEKGFFSEFSEFVTPSSSSKPVVLDAKEKGKQKETNSDGEEENNNLLS